MSQPRPVAAWPSPDGQPPAIEVSSAEAGRVSGRAMLMIVGAVGLFACADVFAKLLSQSNSAPQVAWVRYAMLLLVAVLLARRKSATVLRPRRPGLQALRAAALLGSGVLFILGLSRLPVAEATAVSFVTPMLVTILSVLVLNETVRLRRWAALIVGLIGVLVVLRPGGGALQPAVLFPLGSAACGALMVILTRRIGGDDPVETTLLWSAGLGFVALSLSAPLWIGPMPMSALGFAAGMGLCYAFGQYLLVKGYASGEASVLAPFSYAQVLFAAALGGWIFGDWPDQGSLIGIGLIVLSGVYLLSREGVLARLRIRGASILRARRRVAP